MPSSKRPTRYEQRILKAMELAQSGLSCRKAAHRNNVPLSTAQYRLKSQSSSSGLTKRRTKRSLTEEEESLIVTLLQRYGQRGVPLRKAQLREAIEIIVACMPPMRREKLRFKNGSPGPCFLRSFTKQHSHEIRFARPVRQEGVRFNAVNGQVLAYHYALIEKLIEDNDLDADRIWNCDETGATPGRDADGKERAKVYVTRGGERDARVGTFNYTNRVTILPAISAAGSCMPPMFVFKGKTLPYRVMLKDGERIVETFANSLPSGSFACMREQGGGVDAKVFMRWAQLFASHVSHLTQNNRRVLLIMDAYRSHMILRLLEYLNERGIIVYALPAHTSGKTQPLDVTVFSPFKAFLNEAVNMSVAGGNPSWDGFAFCKMLRYAYEKAFTISTIKAGFRRAGLWPFDPSRLLSVPRPPSLNDTYSLLPVNELEGLLEKKERRVEGHCIG